MHRALSACAVLTVIALTGCDKSSSSSDTTTSASASRPLTGDKDKDHDRGRPGGGGNEMFEACTGKTAGTACTVKMHDKDVNGTCTAAPGGAADAKLMCKLEGAPGAPPGAPPPH